MNDECVVMLGAGATKACDGPLANEILPWASADPAGIDREDNIGLAMEFIRDVFGVEPAQAQDPNRLPSLTLILSLIDIALDRRETFGCRRQLPRLVEARNHYDVTPDGSRFPVNSRLPDDAAAPIIVVLNWASEFERR